LLDAKLTGCVIETVILDVPAPLVILIPWGNVQTKPVPMSDGTLYVAEFKEHKSVGPEIEPVTALTVKFLTAPVPQELTPRTEIIPEPKVFKL